MSTITRKVRGNIAWHVFSVRDYWAWKILGYSEAAHRVAFRLSSDIPSPEQRQQAFMIGLLAGTGDLGGALKLNPNVGDLAVIADRLGLDVVDLLMWMQLEAAGIDGAPVTSA